MKIHVRRRAGTLAAGLLLSVFGCDATNPVPPVVSTVELSATSVAVGPTLSTPLIATPRAADGSAIAGKTIAWSAADLAIATVSGTGSVTGVAFGVTTITATVDGKSADVTVSVVPTQPSHLAGSWRMDSFEGKTVPAPYAILPDEPLDDGSVVDVVIRLDSATKTMTNAAQYQRRYCFTELHDDVPRFKYCWGDHGTFALGTQVPVSLALTSHYIQHLFTAGSVTQNGDLTLNEEIWTGEAPQATVWKRRD